MGLMGPIKVIRVSPTAVTKDEHGTENTVTVNRATIAPTGRDAKRRCVTQSDNSNADHEEPHANGSNFVEENVTVAPREYAVDGIVRHVGKGDNVR